MVRKDHEYPSKDDWMEVTNKYKYSFNPSLTVIPPPPVVIAKGDSGATNHYFALQDAHGLDDTDTTDAGIEVTLPTKATVTSTHQGHLPFSNLSKHATKTEVFPDLHHSLISLGQLCDDDCLVLLHKKKLIAAKDGKIVLTGDRNQYDKLWDIPLPQRQSSPKPISKHVPLPKKHSLNVILRKDKTKSDLVQYLHAACFSPTTSTFLQAIQKNFLLSWPGLTSELVKKHLPTSVYTTKGHINQERQGLQSTKEKHLLDDMHPQSDEPNVKTKDVIYALYQTTEKAFMDLTGRFPFTSSRGNEYILIGYHYDSNAILGRALKNRQAATITKAWKSIHEELTSAGVTPNTWILDNETSLHLQSAMKKKNTNYQLVPPQNHRSNAAERAIQTFKTHFKTGLATVDSEFPIAEWDRLLDQAFLTLNLLRSSRINPKLSAYAQLHGQFDFNATPLAPPGTKVVIHNKPESRASWDLNGQEGWYIGRSPQHYRCVKCFIPRTRTEVNTDTVVFIPQKIEFPKVTTEDFLRQAAADIISLLTHPPPSTVPSLQGGDATKNALLDLATILNTSTKALHDLQDSTKRTTAAAANLQASKQPNPINTTFPQSTLQIIQETLAQLTRVPEKTKQTPLHPHNKYNQHSFKHRATQALVANVIFNHSINHVYDDNGNRLNLDDLITGPTQGIWIKATCNEIGRLAQGYGNVKGTDTIEFISHRDVPENKKVTYANFVCDIRPLKSEPHRVRLVVGGDKLDYLNDAGSPAASLLETKLLVNSVIFEANAGARFISTDLKDFFLASPMAEPEYMKIHRKHIPQEIIDQYQLQDKFHNDYIYVKIKKGMYGLKQAAILAYQHLVNNLAPFGYEPIPHTVGLWRHKTRPITFCLCVDDFGIKYKTREDIDHLLNALGKNYKCTTDWTEGIFVVSPLTGTTRKDMLMFLCQHTLTRSSINSNITNPKNPSEHHFISLHGNRSSQENVNMPQQKILQPY